MKQKKIGLALGSGAWMGLAHIGVIKSLVEHQIPIDYISGSSVGSIVGGLYAVNQDIKEVEKIINSLKYKTVFKSVFKNPLDRQKDFNGRFDRFFKKIIGNVQIEDLKVPYVAIASNLLTGEAVAINHGSLITAMKASSAVPLLFPPIKIDSNYFLDGGMTSPIPIEFVKKMGADFTIGVNLYDGIFPITLKKKHLSRIQAFKISRFLWLQKLAQDNLKSADICLNLKVSNDSFGFLTKFINNRETVDYGYKATNKLISQIKDQFNQL